MRATLGAVYSLALRVICLRLGMSWRPEEIDSGWRVVCDRCNGTGFEESGDFPIVCLECDGDGGFVPMWFRELVISEITSAS